MIPSKLQKGQKFKPATVDKINEILQYLKTQRVVGDNRTIRVNQGASGLLISATPPTPSKGGGKSVQLNHPFKLSFIQDEQSKKSLLKMQSGIIQFMGDVGKVAFCGYKIVQEGSTDEYKAPLPLPTAVGNYGVVLHLFYNPETSQIIHNISFDYRLCYYKDKQISDAINSSGIYSIPIGTINVTKPQETETETETEEGFIYSIIKQNVTSHISVYDQLDVPFKAWFKLNTYPEDGAILESLYPDTIVVNSGAVACNREIISYQGQEVDFQQGRFWLRINTVLNTAELTTESLEPNYTVDEMVYAFPLFDVYKDMESTANIIQGFQGNFSMSYDGRVQLDREDNTVNYLNNKLKYPTKKKEQLSEQEEALYVQGKEYLIGIKENVSMNPDIKDNMDRLYWDWQKIKDYDKQEYLQLNVKMGDLKWQSAYLTLTDDDDTNPNYLQSKISVSNCLKSKVDNHIYKIMGYDVKKGKNIKVEKKKTDTDTPYHEISGYKTTLEQGDGITIDEDISTDGLDIEYTINFDPSILQSIFKSEDKSVTFTFIPPPTDQDIYKIDFSAVKVSVNSTDTSPDYLVNKEFSENGSILFSVVGSRLNQKINPAYFRSQDNTVTFTQGIDYLDLSASGKVKVTEVDPTTGNLADKIISDNDSLLFTVTQVQELSIEINPGYFISTDNSIEFDYTTNPKKLDLKGGKVKVTEDDTADYLGTKIDSEDISIAITVKDDLVDLAINPAYFISTDNSIEFDTKTPDKLNLKSNGKIKVTEADPTSGYLAEKIISDNSSLTFDVTTAQQLNIEINSAYFVSSDDSIEIDSTDPNKLDLKSNGKVKVTENDTPDYLGTKIDSEDISIEITVKDDLVDLAINPAYFISSDDSIEIDTTDTNKLDLKSNGKVKVNENDTADYLGTKFDSEDLTITITPKDNVIDLGLNMDIFLSDDDSIQISTDGNLVNLQSRGKVKCTQSDTADYLNSKIQVDSSIASLITLDKQADKIVIKSAIQGSGIMLVNNGAVSLLQASGNAVLACQGGVIKWIPYSDCENACNDE